MANNPLKGPYTGYVPTAGSSVGTDANTMQYLAGLNVGASIHARKIQYQFDSLSDDIEYLQDEVEYQMEMRRQDRASLIAEANAIIDQQNETIRKLQAALNKEKAECDEWYALYKNAVNNVVTLNGVLKHHSIPKPPLSRYDDKLKKFVVS